METPNPYDSPHRADEPAHAGEPADDEFINRYILQLTGGLGVGLVICAFVPYLGVPLTLVAAPAMVRATRIYWRKRRESSQTTLTDWCIFFFASIAAVAPVSIVGGITFCCVCTFTASGDNEIALYYMEGLGTGEDFWFLWVAMYVGLVAGLLVSLLLLKQFNYLSKVEKDALKQETTLNSEQSDT
ncbi:MAG: hypothetical protein ABI614_16055 [Planctomycetota bacterium]